MRRNRTEIHIRKATPLWPNTGNEKTDNEVGAVIGIRPETALVPKAKKLRRPSGVKLAMVVLERGEDLGIFANHIGFALHERGGEAISFSKPKSDQTPDPIKPTTKLQSSHQPLPIQPPNNHVTHHRLPKLQSVPSPKLHHRRQSP
ncbi:hypothetical protein CMV_010320 [Castanea mollissima]|uniref:Uncharacterized protein n=1 Tax=Castanea mollissima TaxID=60419 RepID=A0A8J4RJG8_9ROSI|nr:hypothetical protein CMV_010320 [Castanea mollissima]